MTALIPPAPLHPQTSTSPSDGLTLDLIQDAASPPGADLCWDSKGGSRAKGDDALSVRTAGASGKSRSLPREAAVVWEQTTAEKNRCLSMDQILTHSEPEAAPACRPAASSRAAPVNHLQQLIRQKLEKTEQLLKEAREAEPVEVESAEAEPAEGAAATTERLLREAVEAWNRAHEVLEQVKELRALYQQLDSSTPVAPGNGTKLNPDHQSPK